MTFNLQSSNTSKNIKIDDSITDKDAFHDNNTITMRLLVLYKTIKYKRVVVSDI